MSTINVPFQLLITEQLDSNEKVILCVILYLRKTADKITFTELAEYTQLNPKNLRAYIDNLISAQFIAGADVAATIRHLDNEDVEILTAKQFTELWNKQENLPQIRVLSNSRKQKFRARCKNQDFVNNIETILKKLNESSFCTGNNDRHWTATVDWLLNNDTNYVKVLEGKYDNKKEITPVVDANPELTADLIKFYCSTFTNNTKIDKTSPQYIKFVEIANYLIAIKSTTNLKLPFIVDFFKRCVRAHFDDKIVYPGNLSSNTFLRVVFPQYIKNAVPSVCGL